MINCKSVLVSVVICTWSITEGCHVNDWPNSCQANFMIGSHGCEPCATGSYGCNCSVQCLDNTYGQGCYHVCNCSADEYCDPVEGCTINGSIINQTKELHNTTQYPLNVRRNNLTIPYAKGDAYQLLKVVGITIATLLVLGVIFNMFCFCVLYRRKSDEVSVETDAKSKENVRASWTDEENKDDCSYLTISDRSARSYADVNYDDVEQRDKSPTTPMCSIKGKTSKECDPINVKTDQKVKSGCQPSSDYEEMIMPTKI